MSGHQYIPCSITTAHLNALYSTVCVAKTILIISNYKQLGVRSGVVVEVLC